MVSSLTYFNKIADQPLSQVHFFLDFITHRLIFKTDDYFFRRNKILITIVIPNLNYNIVKRATIQGNISICTILFDMYQKSKNH